MKCMWHMSIKLLHCSNSIHIYSVILTTFLCSISLLSNVIMSYSPVHLTVGSLVPPCWNRGEVTQTQPADPPKCVPVCSLHRCLGEVDRPVDRWHVASHGDLGHLTGKGGWNWWWQICRQSSGNERSLEMERMQNREAAREHKLKQIADNVVCLKHRYMC